VNLALVLRFDLIEPWTILSRPIPLNPQPAKFIRAYRPQVGVLSHHPLLIRTCTMTLQFCLSLLLFLLMAMFGAASTFTPMSTNGDDGETLTGLWFRPDLGTSADFVPLKTRLWVTRESVTGGVALKAWFGMGSTGRLARVYDTFSANSAGIPCLPKRRGRSL
jgi:hypothetical protein